MAISVSKSKSIQANIVEVKDQSYSTPLINYVEIDNVNGVNKTKFFTSVMTKVKPGDWVYIVNGNYDNSRIGKVKSTRKGANGWKVLKVDNCQITLDIDWTGILPYKTDEWDNFIKIWVANRQEDVDTYSQQISYEYPGNTGSVPFKYDIYKNNVIYLDNIYIFDRFKGSSLPYQPGFYKSLNGHWIPISDFFDSGFTSSFPTLTPLTSSNYHLLPIDDFNYLGIDYKKGNIYKYNGGDTTTTTYNFGQLYSTFATEFIPTVATLSFVSNELHYENDASMSSSLLYATASQSLELNKFYSITFEVNDYAAFSNDISFNLYIGDTLVDPFSSATSYLYPSAGYYPAPNGSATYSIYAQCVGTTSFVLTFENTSGLKTSMDLKNLQINNITTIPDWVLDDDYKTSYLGKANFRSGSFSGIWNDGVFGTYESQVKWQNGTWNNGVMMNTYVDGTIGSKTDTQAGLKIYYSSLKGGIPKTNLDINNFFGNGLNYIIDSHLHSGYIKNGNVYNSDLINTQTTSVIEMDVTGLTFSHNSLTMSNGTIYRSNIDSINTVNAKIYNSYVSNSKLNTTKLYDSIVKKSVADKMEWNTDGYKILKYKLNYTLIREGSVVIYSHKFFISKEDWLKLETQSIVSIRDLLFNSVFSENMFENTHYLNWKSLWSNNYGSPDGFVLRSNEQNRYNCDVIFDTSLGYWTNSFTLNTDGGYSIDYDGSYTIDIHDPSDTWKLQQSITKNTYISKGAEDASIGQEYVVKSIDEAYLLNSRFESGIIKSSNWRSGYNTYYEYIYRTQSSTHSNLAITLTGSGGDYTLNTYLKGGDNDYFYKNDIDNDYFYLDNTNFYSNYATFSLSGWYKVIANTISTNFLEENTVSLKPITGILTNTVSFVPSPGYYIDNQANDSGYPSKFTQINVYPSRVYITGSNIYSGSFKPTHIYSSNLISNPLLGNDLVQTNYNNLKLSGFNFENNLVVNKGASIFGSLIKDMTWENGILYRSIWNNRNPFLNGLLKQSHWADGTFTNGRFIESNYNGPTIDNLAVRTSTVIGWTTEWYNGTFSNGEMYKSNFFGGRINNGKVWYSTVAPSNYSIDINNGRFGDTSIDKSYTHIVNVDNTKYIHINYAISDNATWEGTIDWYNGVFNDGIMHGIEYSSTNLAPVWYNGLFNNGQFAGNSQWLDGDFRGGRFTAVKIDLSIATAPNVFKHSGIGVTTSNYSWLSGTFSGGIFGDEDKFIKDLEPYFGLPYRSSWYNGVFLGGKFIGRVWNDGVFVNGEFEGSFTQSIITNKISSINILYNGDFEETPGGWELLDSDETAITLSSAGILSMTIVDGGCFGANYLTTRSTMTTLSPDKVYKIVIEISDINGDDIFSVRVSLGGNSKYYTSIGLYEDYITCGVGGEVSIGLYCDGLFSNAQIQYMYIYEVNNIDSISLQEAIDYYSPEFENNWYGLFRTGTVVDSLKKTSGVYSANILPAGSPLLKENYKINNPTKFSDMLWVNGEFNSPLAKMDNSIWLDGKFNNGTFFASYFNPYVKRWDALDYGGVYLLPTLGNYNGDFIYANGGWPTSVVSVPETATFSLTIANTLLYDCEFDGPGAYITSSVVSLSPYQFYTVSFDVLNYGSAYNNLDLRVIMGTNIVRPFNASAASHPNAGFFPPFFGSASYTLYMQCIGATAFSFYVDSDGLGGQLELDNLVITSVNDFTVPYGYNLNTQSCVWNNGILDGGSEFSISDWNNGLFKFGNMYGGQFNNGTVYYMNAYNSIFNNGRWRNGNWYGSDITPSTYSTTAPYPQNKYVLFKDKVVTGTTHSWTMDAGAYNDQILMNMLRNGTQSTHVWNLFRSSASVSIFKKKGLYFANQNNDEVIVSTPPNYNIIISTVSTIDGYKLVKGFESSAKFKFNSYSFATSSQILSEPVSPFPYGARTFGNQVYTRFGNGSFKKGTWENGVWNNGNRLEDAFGYDKIYTKFLNVYLSYEVTPTLWRVILTPTKEEFDKFVANNRVYTSLGIGDDITIGNLVLIDINGNRQVNKLKTKVLEIDLDNGNITFDIKTKFPLRNIERDSNFHLMYVTRNIWLGGTFKNGLFSGVWSDGYANGYASTIILSDTQWISGKLDGAWFNSTQGTYSLYVGLTTSTYNKSVFQTGFINNKYSGMTYINVLDFVYSSYSTTNHEYKYNNKTTEDVLSCSLDDFFTRTQISPFKFPLVYEYGTKYKVYANLLGSGLISGEDISAINVGNSASLPSEIGWYTKDITGATGSKNGTTQSNIKIEVGNLAPYDFDYQQLVSLSIEPTLGDNFNIGYTYSNYTFSSTPTGLYNTNTSIQKLRYSRIKYDLLNLGTFTIASGSHVSAWNKDYNPNQSDSNDRVFGTGSYTHYAYGFRPEDPIILTRNFNGRIDNIRYEEVDRIPLPTWYYQSGTSNKTQVVPSPDSFLTSSFIEFSGDD